MEPRVLVRKLTPEEVGCAMPVLVRRTEAYRKRIRKINAVMHRLATRKQQLALDWGEMVYGLNMQPVNPVAASVLIHTTDGDYFWKAGQEELRRAIDG